MIRRLLLLIPAMACSAAFAVTTSSWTHTSDGDFDGDKDHVVSVSFGELRLSHATHILVEQDPRFDVVYAIRQLADGSVVFATGPDGAIMRFADGKLTELYRPSQSALATALATDEKGQLLVGLSGEKALLLRVDPATGKAQELWRGNEAQLIWDIAQLADHSILLGTGPAGQLIRVQPDGKAQTIATFKQRNILSLLPQTNDNVIIGTDTDGLVIRVSVATGEWFVLYNASEPEITALAADTDGNIYAAASAPSEAGAKPEEARPGRPEFGPELPLRREPVAPPTPPSLPEPNPGEPNPMPKAVSPKQMDILAAGPTTMRSPTSQPSLMPPQEAAQQAQAAPASSAVYRISAGGFANEIFRKPLTIHAMIYADGGLLVGTGEDGNVCEIRLATDEVTEVAQTDSHDVSAMAVDKEGRVLLGVSNPGGLLRMDKGYAAKGTYISKPLDAGQPAQFGNIQLQGTLATGTAMTIATRSGNVADPDNGGWSKWSDELPASEFLKITAPSARFLQYRLTLTTKDPAVTPVVEEVKLFYMLPNIAPKVTAIKIEPQAVEAAPEIQRFTSPSVHLVTWEAEDANNDRLVYTLHYRLGHKGQWILLKDKLTEPSFTWNTREVADGRYQIRVTASDQPSNPAGEGLTATRFSDPIVIDNTPPAIGDTKAQVDGDRAIISLRAVDRTSIVAGVDYSVDSNDNWQAVQPSGMLYDSPDEKVTFTVPKLAPGAHQIAVRAVDSKGNTAYETLLVTVETKK